MREIKFRAWHSTMGKMLYDVTITRGHTDAMQFTGLLDKNGKEGYENDLVMGGGKLWRIHWQAEEARFLLMPEGENQSSWQFMDMLDSYEVVGNRFENPELLQEQP